MACRTCSTIIFPHSANEIIDLWLCRGRCGRHFLKSLSPLFFSIFAVVPVTSAPPAQRSPIENKLSLSYNFFFLCLKFFLINFFFEIETSERHTATDLVKQTSSGILTRFLRGTSFLHKLLVQKHVPVRV